MHSKHNYKITNHPALMDEVYGTTPAIREILSVNYTLLNQKKIIDKLLNDIEKYPTIPQFKQQLATAYIVQKLPKKAADCNLWMYKEHPTYLYAILNEATHKYNQKDYAGMLQYLGPDLQLDVLYPNRTTFHKAEVMNYLSVCAMYLNATQPDNTQQDIILDIMEQIDEGSDVFMKTIDEIERFNEEIIEQKMEYFREYEKSVKTTFVQSIPKTNKPPIFESAIFTELYTVAADIDFDTIKQLLLLPPEEITAACQQIINDSIARFHYFLDDNDEEENNFFVIHALLILGETANEQNLDLVLQILHQCEDYLQFYINDVLTEIAWQPIFKLAKNSIPLLFEFLRKNNIYGFSKTTILQVLEEYVRHKILDKEILIKEYESLLLFFYENKNDLSIIDSLVVADIIAYLVELNAVQHYPLIEKMYAENLVSVIMIGTFDEIIHYKQKYPPAGPAELKTIYEIYNEICEWGSDEEDDDEEDNDDENDYFKNNYKDVDYEETLPIRTEAKIGRNDTCPCGSGNKFKKCCLDKNIY